MGVCDSDCCGVCWVLVLQDICLVEAMLVHVYEVSCASPSLPTFRPDFFLCGLKC